VTCFKPSACAATNRWPISRSRSHKEVALTKPHELAPRQGQALVHELEEEWGVALLKAKGMVGTEPLPSTHLLLASKQICNLPPAFYRATGSCIVWPYGPVPRLNRTPTCIGLRGTEHIPTRMRRQRKWQDRQTNTPIKHHIHINITCPSQLHNSNYMRHPH
jgi:hypothetical protein